MKGIDVSKWQGTVNWSEVKESGQKFVIIREGYGKTGLDKMFGSNYNGAKSVGLDVGVYHYSYADCVAEAIREAEFCIKNISGKCFEMPVVYDIEDSEMLSMSTRKRTDCCKAFCQAVENAGYYAMIYANPNWLKNYLYADELLGRYDLWLAQWGATKPSYECGIWQYSETGKVQGVKGNVDLDTAYKDYAAIVKNKGINGFGKSMQKTVSSPERYYTVKKGDTLAKIAVQYSTTIDKLVCDNGIKDKNKIYVGQLLRL